MRSALVQAIREDKEIIEPDCRLKHDGAMLSITVTVRPLHEAGVPDGLLLVIFEENTHRVQAPQVPAGPADTGNDVLVRQLEFEIETIREDLQSTIEELESSNEELKAANEEVMSMNEELQSANEELETSKEELQSLNEELSTVNSQIQEKIEDLEAANNDITNLLNCTDIAVLFLDAQFRIKRFTPAATQLFKLIPTDVGRPLSDIAQKSTDGNLLSDAEQVLHTLIPHIKETSTGEGTWYLRRIVPYRTSDRRIEGVVITFVDVTASKQAEQDLLSLNESLEGRVAERTRELRAGEKEVLEIAAQEQQRIGQDLHDSVGQELTGLRLKVENFTETLQNPSDKEQARRMAPDCRKPSGKFAHCRAA